MTELPMTEAELRAEEATKLPAFPINLTDIRAKIGLVLDEWKGAGFFTEYTDHSFQHVVDMLDTASWVIPTETKQVMTAADWLMLVLSIYFHDVGLLITKEEFEKRDKNADYIKFLSNPLLTAEKQKQYQARLDSLPSEEADRLKYQEYVRGTHGKRVRSWIEGTAIDDSGASASVKKVIFDLVSKLDITFRKDLALICESHTLNNIDDTSLFKVSRPYGGARETVNLQYVAVILRTVDLLQITRRRAPSVLYQLINPSNPTSQYEWQKQGAVRTVRPAPGRDKDGFVSAEIASDTVEVHATFNDPEGFFGLTSYLSYAEKELAHSYATILRSHKDVVGYKFPWRFIDSREIDTEGFLTDSFEFELDQHKILDLLTGHTLYNNSAVVLRELTQNALDAVRLQADIKSTDSRKSGLVEISWDSTSRSLTIQDNGTGMSQEMIVNHLLKVGSSRYQDQKFKEKHPKFHSISRFGIGVLSAFMVSDDVEITTCHEEEEKARRIALRSVHGKYLIKLLDKVSDRDQLSVFPHGTSVRLVLRPTADIGDVLQVSRSWLMFPRCKVLVRIDGAPPVEVGYQTPKEALEAYVDSSLRKSRFKIEYKVEEFEEDGVTLAFAIAKDELFNDWGFVTASPPRRHLERDAHVPICTCIEGVAVEQGTPGFRGMGIAAVVNAVGPKAPRTNVARSALEDTQEQRSMLESVYKLYARHITNEIERLAKDEKFSLSRAVSVGPFIASPLSNYTSQPVKESLLDSALSTVPLVLVENNGSRNAMSFEDMSRYDDFFTIDSSLYRSVEYFVKEAPRDITADSLLAMLGNEAQVDKKDAVVCNLTSWGYVEDSIKSLYSVRNVVASPSSRSVKLRWTRNTGRPLWFSSSDLLTELLQTDAQFANSYVELRERYRSGERFSERFNIPVGVIDVEGLDDYGMFVASRQNFLVPNTPLAEYLAAMCGSGSGLYRSLASHLVVLDLMQAHAYKWESINDQEFERVLGAMPMPAIISNIANRDEFISALNRTPSKVFDTLAWDKREPGGAIYL